MRELDQITIRGARRSDLPEVVALNLESEHFLSPLDDAALERLHARAAYHRVVHVDGKVGAFLLAFRDGSDYAASNFRWFAQRYDAFVYIDRVVVATRHRGLRLGSALYRDLLQFARNEGVTHVTCEYDLEPYNPASAKFHQSFGFVEVGQRLTDGNKKRVSMQHLALA